jgi:hypothetical protein
MRLCSGMNTLDELSSWLMTLPTFALVTGLWAIAWFRVISATCAGGASDIFAET